MNKKHQQNIFFVVTVILFIVVSAHAEPNSTNTGCIDPNTSTVKNASDANSAPEPNETSFLDNFYNAATELFEEYVDENGLVNYTVLKRHRFKIKDIFNTVETLEKKEYESWPENDKKAFWINLFNLKMLENLTDNYPIEAGHIGSIFFGPYSIRNISPRNEIGAEKWNEYKFKVMNEIFTLSEIETRFILGTFKEPKLLLTLNHGGISSPPPPRTAYRGKTLEQQVKEHITKYLAGHEGCRVENKDEKVYLSAVFQKTWYGKYFLDKYAIDTKYKEHPPITRAALNFVSQYLPQEDVEYLELGNYSVNFIGHKWRLNDQKHN